MTENEPVRYSPDSDTQPPVGEGESLDAINTGSLFESEKKTEPDNKKHFKLDYSKYAKQGFIILVILAVILILAAILLFKPQLDRSAIIRALSY